MQMNTWVTGFLQTQQLCSGAGSLILCALNHSDIYPRIKKMKSTDEKGN